MVFTDLAFLFGFLPIVWLLYRFASRTRLANLYILIVSLVFYAWGGLQSLAILLVVLAWNYFCSRRIGMEQDPELRQKILVLSIAVDVLVLFFYRYLGVWFGFLSSSLARLPGLMPMGLSFYLFSCLSALIDVYRHDAKAPDSFVDFGVYAAFFGRVNMGPIAHYAQFQEQLKHHRTSRTKTTKGVSLFLQGLFRKVLIADNFGLVFAALAGNTSWLGNLLFGFAYFFELYFDFSGYSRMARGIGLLFGFTIPENFKLPYTALSVQDFWRRWHISLTNWFRAYIYIPLGGNRVSHTRWVCNVLCVWLLTGLWHGATWPFLVWGLYQGGLILLEHAGLNRWMGKLPRFIRHGYLILAQLVGWTLFSAVNLTAGLETIGRYFGIGISGFADSAALFTFNGSLILLVSAIVLASGFSNIFSGGMHKLLGRFYFYLSTAGWIILFILCVTCLVSASAQTFLYAVF